MVRQFRVTYLRYNYCRDLCAEEIAAQYALAHIDTAKAAIAQRNKKESK
jgi:hypothetical protein